MMMLGRDLRFAVRMLRREAGTTLVAVLTLGLGFGATIGMFSVMNALLFRALPVHEPERLVSVRRTNAQPGAEGSFSYPAYLELRAARKAVSGVAAFAMAPVNLDAGHGTQRTVVTFVSDNYFAVLGVRPELGRFLTGDDGRPGAPPVVVLGWETWRQRFSADRAVLGRLVRVNGVPATVVGVAPEGFNGTIGMLRMDAWASLPAYQEAFAGNAPMAANRSWLSLFGRLSPGVNIARARAMLESASRGEGIDSAGARKAPRVTVVPLRSADGRARTALGALSASLLATALLVLGIASTNVAGLLLARSLAREKEYAMRAALGATRRQVLVQSLTESGLLWGAGACLGLAIAAVVVKRLPGMMPVQQTLPVRLYFDAALDGRVIGFALLVSLVSGLVFGSVPAMRASSADLMLLLRDSAGPGKSRSWVHGVALAAQVAGSVLLLIVAGLFVRSMQHAATVDPGFDPDGVTWASIDVSARRETAANNASSLAGLLAAIREDPAASAAGIATEVPLGGSVSTTMVTTGRGGGTPVRIMGVSPGYFGTLRIPVLRGRDFAGTLGSAGAEAIVTPATAERLWPGQQPIGQQLQARGGTATVVGVVGDAHSGRLGEAPHPTVYLPFSGESGEAHVFVRAASTRDGAEVIRRAVAATYSQASVAGPAPLRGVILSALPQGMLGGLVGGFGALSIILTALGIFGAVAFFVVQSAREIGIRAALGASPPSLMRFVLGRGMAPAFTGLSAGVALALLASRILRSFLAGLHPWDPMSFILSLLLVLAVGGVAALLPTIWAVRRSPISNLHGN